MIPMKFVVQKAEWPAALGLTLLVGYWAATFLPTAKSNQIGELYGLIIALAFSFVILSRLIIWLVAVERPAVLSPEGTVYSFIAGLSASILYGPKMLVKFYEYDDWVYLGYKYQLLTLNYLNDTINYHYVPVLKFLLYIVDLFFPPNYVANGVLFLFALVFCVVCLLELSIRVIKQAVIPLLITVLFAVWPTADTSRYWFGGGFWLLLPIPFYILLFLRFEYFCRTGRLNFKDGFKAFGLASLTVLSSSQIIIPAFGLLAYFIGLKTLTRRDSIKATPKNTTVFFAIILLPTLLALYERSLKISQTANFAGLLDGSFFVNIAVFVKVKLLYSKFVWVVVLLITMLGIVKYRFAVLRAKIDLSINYLQAQSLAVVAMGLACFALFVLQVGIARSWEIYAVLTPYYSSYPLFCWFLMAIGLVSIALNINIENRSTSSRFILPKIDQLVALLLVLMAVHAAYNSYFINRLHDKDYALVNDQRQHIEILGKAACDVLDKNDSARILIIPYKRFYQCPECQSLFKAPQSFIDDFSRNDEFFRTILKEASEQFCLQDARRFVVSQTGGEFVTTGIDISPLMLDYYKKYYNRVAE